MTVTIRPARADDADALTLIAACAKRANGYDDAFMAACADEMRVTTALLNTHQYWVAESHEPCGFICLEVDPDRVTGLIGALYIAPDWQRRGIGKLLWRTAEGSAKDMGLTGLHLDADPNAEAFYLSLGFSTIGRVPSGSIAGRTLPHMQIDLLA